MGVGVEHRVQRITRMRSIDREADGGRFGRGALAVGFAVGLVFGASACSGSDDDLVGAPDGGRGAPAMDAQPARDAGFEGSYCGDGTCDPDESWVSCGVDCPILHHCVSGEEGCGCTSSFARGDAAFARDDCIDSDNLCVPWDVLSGRGMEVMIPAQSCVKPCTVDADCGRTDDGAPRACTAVEIPGAPIQLGSICVDRVAELDAFCGTSGNTTVLVTTEGARVHTPEALVGCAPDAVCLLNTFDTLNPDEGVCVQACGRAEDAPCPAASPYCNPVGLEIGTSTAGLCVPHRRGFGAWCDLDDPERGGFATACDAAGPARLQCLDLNVIGIPAGVCFEECNEGGADPDDACDATDPDQGIACQVLDPTTGDGVCVHTDVALDRDTCAGLGTEGEGRVGFGVVFGDERIPARWCVDRFAPSLAPARFDASGAIVTTGDFCGENPLDAYHCPEPSLCSSDGVCFVGCALADATYCDGALATLGQTSTTATCFMTNTSTVVGVCGGD